MFLILRRHDRRWSICKNATRTYIPGKTSDLLSSYTTIQLRHIMIRLRHEPRAQGMWNDKRGNLAALLEIGTGFIDKSRNGKIKRDGQWEGGYAGPATTVSKLKRCYLWPQASQHGQRETVRRSFDQIKEDMGRSQNQERERAEQQQESITSCPQPSELTKGECCQSLR